MSSYDCDHVDRVMLSAGATLWCRDCGALGHDVTGPRWPWAENVTTVPEKGPDGKITTMWTHPKGHGLRPGLPTPHPVLTADLLAAALDLYGARYLALNVFSGDLAPFTEYSGQAGTYVFRVKGVWYELRQLDCGVSTIAHQGVLEPVSCRPPLTEEESTALDAVGSPLASHGCLAALVGQTLSASTSRNRHIWLLECADGYWSHYDRGLVSWLKKCLLNDHVIAGIPNGHG